MLVQKKMSEKKKALSPDGRIYYSSTIKHSSIEEESSPIKHLSEEESPFIEEEEDEIIIDDVPYEFSF